MIFSVIPHGALQAGITAEKGAPAEVGSLLYDLAIKYPESAAKNRPAIIAYVVQGKMNRNKLNAALAYAKSHAEAFDAADFEKACGVNVSVSEADVKAKIVALLDRFATELAAKKYDFVQTIYGEVKKDDTLKWADGYLSRSTLCFAHGCPHSLCLALVSS